MPTSPWYAPRPTWRPGCRGIRYSRRGAGPGRHPADGLGGGQRVSRLQETQIARRVKVIAKAAGLVDWKFFSGDSGRVGMARPIAQNGVPTHLTSHQPLQRTKSLDNDTQTQRSATHAVHFLSVLYIHYIHGFTGQARSAKRRFQKSSRKWKRRQNWPEAMMANLECPRGCGEYGSCRYHVEGYNEGHRIALATGAAHHGFNPPAAPSASIAVIVKPLGPWAGALLTATVRQAPGQRRLPNSASQLSNSQSELPDCQYAAESLRLRCEN